jgi:MYXO-CTERM domain-containing protein
MEAWMGGWTRVGLAVGVVAGLWCGSPDPARACGAFFCDGTAPVNQAAERIIFAKNADDTVTAVIQILYQGPAERFSWVLPVPGVPEVQVSSDLAFARLQAATNPVHTMATRVEGTCASPTSGGGGPDAFSVSDAGTAWQDGSVEDAPLPVQIVGEGNVGPYDYVVISLDPELAHPGDAAVEWLQSNGYDVDDFGRERLGPYLAGGLNLIAFRLSKGQSAGSIRPIRITFPQGAPAIPIRPTAVAANDDMGVLVWVLGPSRAVPINYLALELNDALINWFNPGPTYDAVVTAAADEAGGHGFVTEMAGLSSTVPRVIVSPSEQSTWSTVQASDWDGAHGELLWRTTDAYGSWDGFADVLERHVPVPEGVALEDFYACPGCYVSFTDPHVEGFDAVAYVADLGLDVVEPMRDTQALLDGSPYMTRLYTTLSPAEMTVDPLFDFNPDLPDVQRIQSATRVIECCSSVFQWEAPWRAELPSGLVVRGRGTGWPLQAPGHGLPFNRRILDMTTRGEGIVVADNTEVIVAALGERNAPLCGTGASRCSIVAPSPVRSSGILWAAALVLFATLWRRRRNTVTSTGGRHTRGPRRR